MSFAVLFIKSDDGWGRILFIMDIAMNLVNFLAVSLACATNCLSNFYQNIQFATFSIGPNCLDNFDSVCLNVFTIVSFLI
jgi:hypothetical protein